jgi:DNA-binding response OmpR family regulator
MPSFLVPSLQSAMPRHHASPRAIMLLTHPPTASVAIVATAGTTAVVADLIGDEVTTVVRHAATADGQLDTELWERPDVLVIDRAAVRDVARDIWHLRRRWPTIFITVLNAHDEADTVRLLNAGADDAILTDSMLLRSRLQAMARRARTVNAGSRIAIGDVVFDREARRVWCNGVEVAMTPRECAVIDCLFWNSPRAVGVSTLADFVWGDRSVAERRNVIEVYIGYVRRKLRASQSVVLRTIRGVGYGFAPRD